jgi:ribonuclease HI
MPDVEIWTDGASNGKTGGPGGWGAVLVSRGTTKELSGHDPETTNNRMELRAAIEALNALRRPCSVRLYSDSEYVVKSINEGYVARWQKTGWMNAGKQPVKNQDLWRELLEAADTHEVEWTHVRGHADDPGNIRADELAVAAKRPPVVRTTEAGPEPERCIHDIPPERCHVCSGRVKQMIDEKVPPEEMVNWLIEHDAWLPEELRGDYGR